MKDVLIIGGGLAGLVSAIQLARGGLDITVLEKKTYPFHKVCGEYVSQEVLPYINSLGIDPWALGASKINSLVLSSSWKNSFHLPLDLGGFGISRYKLDLALANKAKEQGAEILENTQVAQVNFIDNYFEVILSNGKILQSKFVIGSYGKRSNLDRELKRKFFLNRSPFVGIKYHIHTDHPADTIALHNFFGGYSGLNKIEDGKYCLCYLARRESLKQAGSIEAMEHEVLYKNEALKTIFNNSQFLFAKPEVINEISFEKKDAIENHILMAGDAVGMISPLCGNGMAMAIHSGKIVSETLLNGILQKHSREIIETEYKANWSQVFEKRLSFGRKVQHLFGNELATFLVLSFFNLSNHAAKWVVNKTHGNPF